MSLRNNVMTFQRNLLPGSEAVETMDFLLEFLSDDKMERVRVQMLVSFE